MPIDAGDIGSRVVIRSRLPGRIGPSGGPALTDVIGELETYDDITAVVVRRDGTRVSVPVTDVVAAKRVPKTRAGGLKIGSGDLQRICAAGWPAPVLEPLGDWMLRAAGGFTGRANSALVAGDPGLPVPEALIQVSEFYHRHGLPPRAQVVVGSAEEESLGQHAWSGIGGPRGGALVMVATLHTAPTTPGSDVAVELAGRVDERWLALYNRAGGHDPALVRSLLEGPAQVAFARIGDPPVAVGRMVVTEAWAGLSAVEVLPELRRTGMATAVVDALRQWAIGEGARWCYLQVTEGNAAALTLWRQHGYRHHHSYRYLSPSPRVER